ncbi:MAG: NfeD family protein [Phycisphaerae bacterium]|nr:NfeD family protein [Phycisphaerae bacterium]
MAEWWHNLNGINQGFYVAAAFFSVFFVWQLIAALIGLGGGEDEIDADAHDYDTHGDIDHDFDHDIDHDALDSVAAFKLLSVRSILAFCTLFSWAGAMYLQGGKELQWAVALATAWGAVAMIAVAMIFHLMRRMTESGNMSLASCVGTEGTAYIDIPSAGMGEARVTVSGVMQVFKARGATDAVIPAGTPITVTRVLSPNTIEVKTIEKSESSENFQKTSNAKETQS